jgi:hypothetical protein
MTTRPHAPRSKQCSVCLKPFMPARPLQAVCSPRCAHRKVKLTKEKEREEFKKRRAELETIPELLRKAQTEFNKWVRTRDHDQPCISCGAPPPDLSGLHAGRDAGHYRSVGSASHLRFHVDNVHAQCVKCNQWGAGRAVDYRIGLIARIGQARVEALEADNTPRKWTREELRSIRDTYRQKLKDMRKEQA